MRFQDLMLRSLWVAAGVVLLQSMHSQGQAPVPPAPPTPVDGNGAPPAAAAPDQAPGVDVLTRGPLHEALAEPVNLGGAVPPVVAQQPPAPIVEAPASYRPDSDSAAWIPGYWSWSGPDNRFVWVSGVWRIPPPGMQWVPGYWTTVNGGYQWSPGFWNAAETEQVDYYPQPPAPQEQGPTTDAPQDDAFWTPGCWQWRGGRFAWSPGFWAAGRADWVWTPTCYSWTPNGYVMVNGFWDYTLAQRGVAFSPVAIGPSVYAQPGFVYTPNVAINPSVLSFYLFARPAACQYYFGDYFGPEYDRLGYYPWYDVGRTGAYIYDPLFTYDKWYYRNRDPQWVENLGRWHRYYRDHPDARPPHTWAEQQRLAATRGDRPDRRMLAIGQPIGEFARGASLPFRLSRTEAADRTRFMDAARGNREFQTQRLQGHVAAGLPTAPRRGALPRGPQTFAGVRTNPGDTARAQQPGATRQEVLRPVEPSNGAGEAHGPSLWGAKPPPRPSERADRERLQGSQGGGETRPPQNVQPRRESQPGVQPQAHGAAPPVQQPRRESPAPHPQPQARPEERYPRVPNPPPARAESHPQAEHNPAARGRDEGRKQ